MSMLINMSSGMLRNLRANDLRNHLPEDKACTTDQAFRPEAGYLRPRSQFMGGGSGGVLGLDNSGSTNPFYTEVGWEDDGNPGRKKLTGHTYDANGNALGGVSLQAIRADGSEKDGSVTSDGAGYYDMPISNPSGNYKVDAYLAGSPDVAGTTKNTLTPV